jgi:protein O-GlcNAc transferase
MSAKKKKKGKRRLSSAKSRSIQGESSSNRSLFDTSAELRKAFQHVRSGRLQEAQRILEKVLREAFQYLQSGQLEKAEGVYEEILRIVPNHSETLYLLGVTAHGLGKTCTAVDLMNKAIVTNPKNPFYHNDLGNVFQDQGKLNEAILCYQKAVELEPNFAEAYNNMGTSFQAQGKSHKAITCYRKVLELRPGFAEAYNNMGNVFQDQGKLNEAILCYQKAVELEPNFAEAYNNMGNVFQDQGKLNEALSCYQDALKLKPDYAKAYNNMANAFQDQGKINEAICCFQKALQLKPDYAEAYSQLVYQLQRMCAWHKVEGMTSKLDSLTMKALHNGTKTAETPFISITRHDDLSRHLAIAKSWSSDIVRRMANVKTHFSFDSRSSRKNKIVVGYLSNDFRNQPTAHLMLSLFGLHDRNQFEIFCYSYGIDDGSHYRARIQEDCDKFVDLRDLDHIDAAQCIYEDKVDILVDLMGYTKGNRLEICALRPAPIQATYLGFPGTTGADFVDYIITDRIVTPEEHAAYFSEKFVYMPNCYQVNDHTQAISNKVWNKVDFGLPEDGFIFCSFNNPYKIEPVVFDVWMKILRQIPKSVLWLGLASQTAQENLRRETEERGVAPERLVFSKSLPLDEHLARLRLADLALDTRIYNGGATTSNALWAGVRIAYDLEHSDSHWAV